VRLRRGWRRRCEVLRRVEERRVLRRVSEGLERLSLKEGRLQRNKRLGRVNGWLEEERSLACEASWH